MARSLYFVSGVLVRFPYSKRLFAICGDIRAASLAIGEVLSPFRPVQAVIPGRLVSPDMDSASPWEFHLRLFVRSRAFPESVPSSELRGGSIAFAPLRFTCGDFAPPLPGVAGRPTGRLASPDMAFVSPSASHLRLSLPFALSNPVPNYTQLSVRGVVRPPYVAAPSSRSLAIGKVLSPVQATIRVVYRLVSGATRFAGYGRWHSSRRSLLLGFHLF